MMLSELIRMNIGEIALLGGIIFILSAIFGGNLKISGVELNAPIWARGLSLLVGIFLIFPLIHQYFPLTLHDDEDVPRVSEKHSDIKLTHLKAESDHRPPLVNDIVNVEFTLKNDGAESFKPFKTLVGARAPYTCSGYRIRDENAKKKCNKDSAHVDRGKLEPGEKINVKVRFLVDAEGEWTFWPCYTIGLGNNKKRCPNEWAAFSVGVEERK